MVSTETAENREKTVYPKKKGSTFRLVPLRIIDKKMQKKGEGDRAKSLLEI